MNREITDIYKKDFFLDFGKQISQTRQRQGLDIDDVSEMTGMSKIKIKSIEKGCEERLLRLPLSAQYLLRFGQEAGYHFAGYARRKRY